MAREVVAQREIGAIAAAMNKSRNSELVWAGLEGAVGIVYLYAGLLYVSLVAAAQMSAVFLAGPLAMSLLGAWLIADSTTFVLQNKSSK